MEAESRRRSPGPGRNAVLYRTVRSGVRGRGYPGQERLWDLGRKWPLFVGHLSPTSGHSSNRRDFMRLAAGAGASLGLASLFATPARAGAATAPPAASGKPFDLVGLKMPFRQDDPAWGRDVMWDRKLVLKAAALNKTPKATANVASNQRRRRA